MISWILKRAWGRFSSQKQKEFWCPSEGPSMTVLMSGADISDSVAKFVVIGCSLS